MKKRWLTLLIVLLWFQVAWAAVSYAAPPLKQLEAEPQPSVTGQVALMLNSMSLEEKIGQLFIVSADLANKDLPAPVGGYILFKRHTPDIESTLALTQHLRSGSLRLLPFIAVDQEGGRVARLDFVSKLPAMRRLAGLRPQTVSRIAWLLGQELREIGFNLNFAPVMDVATRSDNPVIGDRSFSPDPLVVANLGVAFIDGLQSAGVSAAAKHFPGHGDTRTDSHQTLPTVGHPRERLERVELLPFQAAVNKFVDMVMVGHLHFPTLDPSPNLPATLSPPVISGLLRDQLGYEGIIITDAMDMRAVTNGFDSGQAAVSAFRAGVDIILMPADFHQAYMALLGAVKTGEIAHARLDESLRRILMLKQRLAARQADPNRKAQSEWLATIGPSSHRIWLEKLLKDQIEFEAEPRH